MTENEDREQQELLNRVLGEMDQDCLAGHASLYRLLGVVAGLSAISNWTGVLVAYRALRVCLARYQTPLEAVDWIFERFARGVQEMGDTDPCFEELRQAWQRERQGEDPLPLLQQAGPPAMPEYVSAWLGRDVTYEMHKLVGIISADGYRRDGIDWSDGYGDRDMSYVVGMLMLDALGLRDSFLQTVQSPAQTPEREEERQAWLQAAEVVDSAGLEAYQPLEV